MNDIPMFAHLLPDFLSCGQPSRKMNAPGADDEAIAAQLHRELNAFTRRAARGDLPPLKPLRKRRRKDGGSPGDSGHPSSSAPTRSPAASSSGEHAERDGGGARMQTPEELQEAQGTSQPSGRRGGGGHGASRFAPEPPSWYAALADAAATSAKRRAAGAQRPLAVQQDADQQQAARQTADNDAVHEVASEHGSGSGRSVKCFCAGVRWGVSLPADWAKDRSALAAAVRGALSGTDAAACRDDCHVLMLDSSGTTTSFPGGTPVAQGAWDPAAATAVRIYVR